MYDLAPPLRSGGDLPARPPVPEAEAAAPDVDAVPLVAPPPLPPPLAPPPPLEDRARPVRVGGGRKNPPRAAADVPNGQISFYESNGNFVAYCNLHRSCILTRRGRPPSDAAFHRAPERYRPLGLLMNWLATAQLWEDREEQFFPGNLEFLAEEGEEARHELAAIAGGGDLLGCERPLP